MDRILDATISVDSKKIFKPAPTLTHDRLESGVATLGDVLFVSSIRSCRRRQRRFGLKSSVDRSGDARVYGLGLPESDLGSHPDHVQGTPDADG